MARVKINKPSSLDFFNQKHVSVNFIFIGFYAFIFINIFTFSVNINDPKQDKTSVSKNITYKDSIYKYSILFPSNYLIKKSSDKSIVIKEQKDLESTVRVAVSIQNFGTSSSSGTIYNFSEFVKKHVAGILDPVNTSSVIDSIMIKEYICSSGLKGKENYVRIVDKVQQNSKDKESQIIKGPVYIFDISAKTGIPGTALVFYQKTDDSKTSKLLRNIVEGLRFE